MTANLVNTEPLLLCHGLYSLSINWELVSVAVINANVLGDLLSTWNIQGGLPAKLAGFEDYCATE